MPYCTIEEAWGNSQYNFIKEQDKIEINNKVKIEQVPKNIVPENSYDYQDMYNNVQYPNIDYDQNILSIYPVREEALQDAPKDYESLYDRSNYDSLGNHNDNNKLLQKNIESIEKYNYQKKNVNIKLSENETENNKEIINKNSKKEKEKEHFSNKNKNEYFKSYIEHLENQNKQLKNYLQVLKKKNNSSSNSNSNIFDLLLYIISGIFIIFILDSFVNLIKNK